MAADTWQRRTSSSTAVGSTPRPRPTSSVSVSRYFCLDLSRGWEIGCGKPNTLKISFAPRVKMAPSRMRLLDPSWRGSIRRAGHHEDLTALFGGPLGGDQRARAGGGLDHDHAGRQSADDAVATREGTGDRRRSQRNFGQQQSARPRPARAARRSAADRPGRCRRPARRSCRWRSLPRAPPYRCRAPAPRPRRSRLRPAPRPARPQSAARPARPRARPRSPGLVGSESRVADGGE